MDAPNRPAVYFVVMTATRVAMHTPVDAALLLKLSRDVTSTLDLQEVLDRTFASLRLLIDFGGGSIQLIEEGYLVLAATDPPATLEAKAFKIPVGQGVGGTIAVTGEAIYIPDIFSDPRVHPEGRKKATSPGVRSWFGVPLIIHGGPTGVLQIDSPRIDAFGPAERARLLTFTPTVAAAVQNARLYLRERELLEQLRDTQRMKRDFLAMIPHELRTPLTSVAGFGHTLARHAARLDPATVADMGERIWRASRRLERVMGDLLDLSNIERGIFQARLVPTDVDAILRDAAREQHDDDHAIELVVEPGLPRALVDGDRLHQIVGNLLSNARKFSPSGAPIEVGARRDDGTVTVSVTDHGKGIPRDQIDHVFEPFFQLERADTRSAEGLGIGLYMVRVLCERMNAAVEVESPPGGGTRVTVRLPVAGEGTTLS